MGISAKVLLAEFSDINGNGCHPWKCRHIVEFEDPNIMRPDDSTLSFFCDEDKETILDFFEFKPYMVSFDYAGRFVKFTFINEDQTDCYVLLYWVKDLNNTAEKLNEYERYLQQNYIVEDVKDRWVFYTKK